jgi:hypothetical protein
MVTGFEDGVKTDDVGFFRKMSSKLSRYVSLGGGIVVLLWFAPPSLAQVV